MRPFLENSINSFISLQMFFKRLLRSRDEKWEIQARFDVKTFYFLEIFMILGEKNERQDQSSFSCLENINFRKSLPRALNLNIHH